MRASAWSCVLSVVFASACGDSVLPDVPADDVIPEEDAASLVPGPGCGGAIVCAPGQALPQCAAASREGSRAFEAFQTFDVPSPADVSVLKVVARRMFQPANGSLTASLYELATGAVTLTGATLRGTATLPGASVPRTIGVVTLVFSPAIALAPRTGNTPRYALLWSVTGGEGLSVGLACATTGTALPEGWSESRRRTGLTSTPVTGPWRRLARDLSFSLAEGGASCAGVAGATCDDGNLADGDGCSSACQVEAGYTCEGTPSVCADREVPRWPITPTPYTGWVTGTDVVTDPATGMMWERRVAVDPETQSPWYPWLLHDRAGALAYCADLVLGGHSDWRLPTRHELATIADHSRDSPALDTTVFLDTYPQTFFWSSSLYLPAPDNAWGMATFLGTSELTDVTSFGYPVKCVRAGNGGPVGQRFEASADSVLDRVTGLTWQRASPASGFGLAAAIAYCDGLDLAGSTAWRLPTLRELESLVDVRRSGPAIDTTAFPDAVSDWFRSSSTFFGGAFSLLFADGQSSPQGTNESWRVRCVH